MVSKAVVRRPRSLPQRPSPQAAQMQHTRAVEPNDVPQRKIPRRVVSQQALPSSMQGDESSMSCLTLDSFRLLEGKGTSESSENSLQSSRKALHSDFSDSSTSTAAPTNVTRSTSLESSDASSESSSVCKAQASPLDNGLRRSYRDFVACAVGICSYYLASGIKNENDCGDQGIPPQKSGGICETANLAIEKVNLRVYSRDLLIQLGLARKGASDAPCCGLVTTQQIAKTQQSSKLNPESLPFVPTLKSTQGGLDGDDASLRSNMMQVEHVLKFLSDDVVGSPDDVLGSPQSVTTVMLANVPKCVSREHVAQVLDRSGFEYLYDTVDLPQSCKTKDRLGYALISFKCPLSSEAFISKFHGVKARDVFKGVITRKVLKVTLASVQGSSPAATGQEDALTKDTIMVGCDEGLWMCEDQSSFSAELDYLNQIEDAWAHPSYPPGLVDPLTKELIIDECDEPSWICADPASFTASLDSFEQAENAWGDLNYLSGARDTIAAECDEFLWTCTDAANLATNPDHPNESGDTWSHFNAAAAAYKNAGQEMPKTFQLAPSIGETEVLNEELHHTHPVTVDFEPHAQICDEFEWDAHLLHQLEYYFSEDNLIYDVYLRSIMDAEGWVALRDLILFPRLQQLRATEERLHQALIWSSYLETHLLADKVRIRDDWLRSAFLVQSHDGVGTFAQAAASEKQKASDAHVGRRDRRRRNVCRLASNLTKVDGEDPNCVVMVHRVHRLGFESAEILRRHCEKFGRVLKVLLSNEHDKDHDDHENLRLRVRPSSIAIILMHDADGAAAVIKAGDVQEIDGAQLNFRRFVRREDLPSQNRTEAEHDDEGDTRREDLPPQDRTDVHKYVEEDVPLWAGA